MWWTTPVECWSALARLCREDGLSPDAEDAALRRLDVLRHAWYEVAPSEAVRLQARRLLRIDPLRAADALQLVAALLWLGDYGDGEFVVADGPLPEAARLEGSTSCVSDRCHTRPTTRGARGAARAAAARSGAGAPGGSAAARPR